MVGMSGCENLTGSPGLPSGTPNPSFYNNKTGAIGMYTAAVFAFETVIPRHLSDTGLLTDELEDPNQQPSTGQQFTSQGQVRDPLDERIMPQGSDAGAEDYGALQGAREFANQAIGALATYDTATFYDTAAVDSAQSKNYRSTLYALEGYTELWLADFFCSGIPLSTLDYGQDFTVRAGSTTTGIYQDARAKFDTALSLATLNDSVLNLARVGKGRAWLDLRQYDSAAAAVQTVPNGFEYSVPFNNGGFGALATMDNGVSSGIFTPGFSNQRRGTMGFRF